MLLFTQGFEWDPPFSRGQFINTYGTSGNPGKDLLGLMSKLLSLTLSWVCSALGFCPGWPLSCHLCPPPQIVTVKVPSCWNILYSFRRASRDGSWGCPLRSGLGSQLAWVGVKPPPEKGQDPPPAAPKPIRTGRDLWFPRGVTVGWVPAVCPPWGACLTCGPLAFQLEGPTVQCGWVCSPKLGTKGVSGLK